MLKWQNTMTDDPRIEAVARYMAWMAKRPGLDTKIKPEDISFADVGYYMKDAHAALAAADAAERQNLNDAPHDGTPIKARIADWYTVAWQRGFEDADGRETGAWVCLDLDHPPSWTEGVCWVNNENNKPSAPIMQARYTPPQEQDT